MLLPLRLVVHSIDGTLRHFATGGDGELRRRFCWHGAKRRHSRRGMCPKAMSWWLRCTVRGHNHCLCPPTVGVVSALWSYQGWRLPDVPFSCHFWLFFYLSNLRCLMGQNKKDTLQIDTYMACLVLCPCPCVDRGITLAPAARANKQPQPWGAWQSQLRFLIITPSSYGWQIYRYLHLYSFSTLMGRSFFIHASSIKR